MSKKLNEAAMQSELSTSAFFKDKLPHALQPETEVRLTQPQQVARTAGADHATKTPTANGPVKPRHHATTTPSSSSDPDPIETIRRAVKPLGKEDATYRFTSEEKKALADVVYRYSVAGIKTSQNEITRIGINSLMEDYRHNGAQSVLVRVLERLNE